MIDIRSLRLGVSLGKFFSELSQASAGLGNEGGLVQSGQANIFPREKADRRVTRVQRHCNEVTEFSLAHVLRDSLQNRGRHCTQTIRLEFFRQLSRQTQSV